MAADDVAVERNVQGYVARYGRRGGEADGPHREREPGVQRDPERSAVGGHDGERNVERWFRRAEPAPGRHTDWRQYRDDGTGRDVRRITGSAGDPVPVVHAVAQEAAVLGEHAERVRRRFLADPVLGVRSHVLSVLAVRPSLTGGTTCVRRRRSLFHHVLGHTVQRRRRQAARVRVLKNGIFTIGVL